MVTIAAARKAPNTPTRCLHPARVAETCMSLDDVCNKALSRYFDVGFHALTPDEQLLVVIWRLEADVNNGGFHQYYFTRYGNFARLAPRDAPRDRREPHGTDHR